MLFRSLWPYAAKAIVQHEWVEELLNVWVIFKFPMQTTSNPLATPIVHDVMPPLDLWLCEVDDVPKAAAVSAWQDEWTLLLTVPDVLSLPARVTLEYDGPHEDLRITWDKQWEPWGPILSTHRGSQGDAVADATGAGDVVLRLNELLAACREYGLIAP